MYGIQDYILQEIETGKKKTHKKPFLNWLKIIKPDKITDEYTIHREVSLISYPNHKQTLW